MRFLLARHSRFLNDLPAQLRNYRGGRGRDSRVLRYGQSRLEYGGRPAMNGWLDHAHAMRIPYQAEEWDMKLNYNVDARKRAVNLTLNEDLLAHVREVTENLSSVVESLLAEYLGKERQRRAAQAKIVESTVALWNQFGDENGSFADDHSTL
jgi:antitoxin CcdA